MKTFAVGLLLFISLCVRAQSNSDSVAIATFISRDLAAMHLKGDFADLAYHLDHESVFVQAWSGHTETWKGSDQILDQLEKGNENTVYNAANYKIEQLTLTTSRALVIGTYDCKGRNDTGKFAFSGNFIWTFILNDQQKWIIATGTNVYNN